MLPPWARRAAKPVPKVCLPSNAANWLNEQLDCVGQPDPSSRVIKVFIYEKANGQSAENELL
jgi:hypothetical protein